MSPSKPSTKFNQPDFFSDRLNDQFAQPSRYSTVEYQFHKCGARPPTTFAHAHAPAPPPPCHQPEWIYRRPRSPAEKEQEPSLEQTFWSSIIRPRSKADRSVPMLGHTNTRSRSLNRRRLPSITSIPSLTSESVASTSSSVTKPFPPPEFNLKTKSIMTRTSSVSTKNSQSKSVKFIDTPTVILDHEYYDESDMDSSYDSPVASTVPLAPKGKPHWGFGWPVFSNKNARGNARPIISGPFVLRSARLADRGDAVSDRSPEYANSGQPKLKKSKSLSFSMRSPASMESFRSTRSSGSFNLRAFCSWG